MKKYNIENRPTPILDKCYCDKCKKDFNEDELIEINFHLKTKDIGYLNIVHGEFCPECLHELIKDHCRYNYDLGKDCDLDDHMKIIDVMKKGELK